MTREEFLASIDEANFQHRLDERRQNERIERGRRFAALALCIGLPIVGALTFGMLLA